MFIVKSKMKKENRVWKWKENYLKNERVEKKYIYWNSIKLPNNCKPILCHSLILIARIITKVRRFRLFVSYDWKIIGEKVVRIYHAMMVVSIITE